MRFILVLGCSLWLAAASAAQPSIRVEAGDWGAASVQDIEAVLQSVADVMLPDFPAHRALRVVVRSSAGGPRVLASKSAHGEHQVLLNVRDTRWDQFAYQFAHELCHIVSNYDNLPIEGRAHQWFEEAVCEAVSVVALQRLAVQWQHAAPHPGWAGYAPAFADYARHLKHSEHRRLAGESMASWYGRHAHQMARDPYLRHKNQVVAAALVALFQTGGLQAVGHLNVQAAGASSFDAYLAAWHDCCPESQRPLVREVIELFRT